MIRRTILILVCVPILYVLAASVGAVIPNAAGVENPGQVELRLIKGPIHYDFMLPVNDTTRARFAVLEQAGMPLNDPRAEWIVAGWGARTFYTTVAVSSDLTGAAVLRGVLGDSSVLRFDIWPDVPVNENVYRLMVTKDQADQLYHAILSDVADLHPIPDVTFTGSDRFFPAKGRFHILRTCNVWLGDKLEQAGIVFGAWTPIPVSVTISRWWFHGGTL